MGVQTGRHTRDRAFMFLRYLVWDCHGILLHYCDFQPYLHGPIHDTRIQFNQCSCDYRVGLLVAMV